MARRARARSSTCARTICDRPAGPRPTPRACRSSPGLARYDEVARGSIDHALRFTAPCTRRAYVYPARHEASTLQRAVAPADGAAGAAEGERRHLAAALPGARRRGRRSSATAMILADNGSPWYISGAPNRHWNNDALHQLDRLTGQRLRGRGHQLRSRHPGSESDRRGANPRPLEPPPRGHPASHGRRPRAWGRDAEVLLAFAAEHRLVLAAQVAVLLGSRRNPRPSAAAAHWRSGGFRAARALFHRQPGCHLITRRGLAAIEHRLPPAATGPAPLPPRRRAWLAVAGGAGGRVRELRRLISPSARCARTTLPLTARPRRCGGVGSAASGQRAGAAPHYPDLLLDLADGHRVAVELELTARGGRPREDPGRLRDRPARSTRCSTWSSRRRWAGRSSAAAARIGISAHGPRAAGRARRESQAAAASAGLARDVRRSAARPWVGGRGDERREPPARRYRAHCAALSWSRRCCWRRSSGAGVDAAGGAPSGPCWQRGACCARGTSRRRARAAAERRGHGAGLGRDRRGGGRARPIASCRPTALILGASGAGKSTTLLTLLVRADRARAAGRCDRSQGVAGVRARAGGPRPRPGAAFRQWTPDGPAPLEPARHGNATELKDKLIATERFTEPHYQRAAERYLQTALQVAQEPAPTARRRSTRSWR